MAYNFAVIFKIFAWIIDNDRKAWIKENKNNLSRATFFTNSLVKMATFAKKKPSHMLEEKAWQNVLKSFYFKLALNVSVML